MDLEENFLIQAIERGFAFPPPGTQINDESWRCGLNISYYIPTLNPPLVLVEYAKLASRVPENGLIIEIGCGLGATTWALAMNSLSSVNILAIERWSDSKNFKPDWRRSRCFLISVSERMKSRMETVLSQKKDDVLEYSQEAFDKQFSKINKVKSLDMHSPPINWSAKADLVFVDVRHRYKEYFTNIIFWSQHLKPGGIIAGVDYYSNPFIHREEFKEVKLAIEDAAKELNKTLTVSGNSFWKLE